MRVTEKMIYEGTIARVTQSRTRMGIAQDQLSSGKRVIAPGDDPAAAALVVRHRIDENRFNAIGTAAQKAGDELNAADAALDNVGNLINRARQLATQLGSDSYGAADRTSGAQEVDGILRQVVTELNARFGERYLFGGFKDTAPPFDFSGAYQGDSGVRTVEVSPGLFEMASVDVSGLATGPTGIVQTLTDLSTALKANDGAGARAMITNFDTLTSNLSTIRSHIGTSVNVFEAATELCEMSADDEKIFIGKIQDADAIDASTTLSLAQYALEATLTAATKTFSLSLVDHMK
jgi:flagellar hook-associated protein 3 FlgL